MSYHVLRFIIITETLKLILFVKRNGICICINCYESVSPQLNDFIVSSNDNFLIL